jgi:A/G-specific adenine glycosylase
MGPHRPRSAAARRAPACQREAPSHILRHVPDPSPLPPDARDAILDWYAEHGRDLPFRRRSDPYAVLVSEAMAQQTQAARVGEAWRRFLDRFPTIADLAAATPADVLREWQGLGYNRRALNLQRAARQVVERHGGRLPADLHDLESLPGVGPYTARAVAAIAFGRPVGAVDTNVRRVLGRIVAGDPAALPAADLQRIADAAVPHGRAADWTHAVMDIGATVCRPRRPACATCPANQWCAFPARAGTGQAAPGRLRQGASPVAFASTSRWLRGRIVDQLRAAPDGAWTRIEGPIGIHDAAAVAAALGALAVDGLIELDDRTRSAGPGHRARLSMT